MYLANYTRPDISFSVNLLSIYSFSPTRRHWNRVKHVLRNLRGTMNMGLFYPKVPKLDLNGHADTCYLSDLIVVDHKQVTCLEVKIQPFHGDL